MSGANRVDLAPFPPHDAVIARDTARIQLAFRFCTHSDLRALEWFGAYTAHREIIEDAYRRQTRGENLMLLAISAGFPVGQIWIDLTRKAEESVGVLWAFRVLPGLRGAGIGSRLESLAEQSLINHGLTVAEVGVECDNARVMDLYDRMGYVRHAPEREVVKFNTPSGKREIMRLDQLLLRKPVGNGAH